MYMWLSDHYITIERIKICHQEKHLYKIPSVQYV